MKCLVATAHPVRGGAPDCVDRVLEVGAPHSTRG